MGIATRGVVITGAPAEIKDRVLAWLQHRLFGEKDMWELVVDNSMNWLNTAVTGDVNGNFDQGEGGSGDCLRIFSLLVHHGSYFIS